MIVIVTDSTACLNRQEAERLGVTHVPMTYTLDGVTHREHFVEENGDYIARIEGAKTFATSQPPIDAYLKTFAELRQAGHQVLCLSISSRLSGTYANEVVCAREVGSEDIRVVDTLTTAGGLYIMVRAARQFLDAGYSLSETAEKLEQMRGKVKTLFSVGDMEPLRRSGRLGPVRPGPRQKRADPRPGAGRAHGRARRRRAVHQGHRGRTPAAAPPGEQARPVRHAAPDRPGAGHPPGRGHHRRRLAGTLRNIRHKKDPPRSRKPGRGGPFFTKRVSLRGAGAHPAGDRAPARGKRSPRPAARPGTARPCPSGPARTAGAGSSLR